MSERTEAERRIDAVIRELENAMEEIRRLQANATSAWLEAGAQRAKVDEQDKALKHGADTLHRMARENMRMREELRESRAKIAELEGLHP